MNRMFITSICDVFRNDEFKEKMKVVDFVSVQTLTWICTSPIHSARRNVHRISKKLGDRKKPVRRSTTTDKDLLQFLVVRSLVRAHVKD